MSSDRIKVTVTTESDARWVRDFWPDADVTVKRPPKAWIDWVAVWFALVGIWPAADPGHDLDTFLSVLDTAIHYAAVGVLAFRWKLVRR